MSTSSSSTLSNISTHEFKLAPAPPPGPKANRLRRASPMRPDHVQVFETVDLGEPMGPVYTGRLSYPTDTLDRPLPEIEPLPAARVPASEAFCRLFMCRVLINALLVALGLLVTCVALAFGLSIAFTVLGRLVIRDFLNSISFIVKPQIPAPLITPAFINALPAGCFTVVPPVWALSILIGWMRGRNPNRAVGQAAKRWRWPGGWLTFLLSATYTAGGLVGALGVALVPQRGTYSEAGDIGVQDAFQAGLLGMGLTFVALAVLGLGIVLSWIGFAKRFSGFRKY